MSKRMHQVSQRHNAESMSTSDGMDCFLAGLTSGRPVAAKDGKEVTEMQTMLTIGVVRTGHSTTYINVRLDTNLLKKICTLKDPEAGKQSQHHKDFDRRVLNAASKKAQESRTKDQQKDPDADDVDTAVDGLLNIVK